MLRAALAGLTAAILIVTVSDLVVFHAVPGRAADFDLTARLVVHSMATPWLTDVIRVLTWLGSSWVLGGLALILFFRLRSRGLHRRAWLPPAAFAAAELLTETAKFVVRRPRPEAWFGLATPETWSFPSGHSLNSMACYIAFAAALAPRSRWRWFAVALAALIGFSRVYLGVHWPIDVITGWTAGACLAAGLVRSNGGAARLENPDSGRGEPPEV